MNAPDTLPSQMIEHGRFVCPGEPMPVIDAGSPEMAREIVRRWNAHGDPDPIIHAHGMGQESAMRDAAAWLTERGMFDLGAELLKDFGITPNADAPAANDNAVGVVDRVARTLQGQYGHVVKQGHDAVARMILAILCPMELERALKAAMESAYRQGWIEESEAPRAEKERAAKAADIARNALRAAIAKATR